MTDITSQYGHHNRAWIAPDGRVFVPNSVAAYPYGLTDDTGHITTGVVALPAGARELVALDTRAADVAQWLLAEQEWQWRELQTRWERHTESGHVEQELLNQEIAALRWLLAEMTWWRDNAMHRREHAEREHTEWAQRVSRALGVMPGQWNLSPREAEKRLTELFAARDTIVPNPTSPAAVDFAATVCRMWNDDPHTVTGRAAEWLTAQAELLRAIPDTDAPAVEELARGLFDGVPPDADPTVGMPGNGLRWEDVDNEEVRDTFRRLARWLRGNGWTRGGAQ